MLLGSKILVAASSIVAWDENLACGSSTSASVENLVCGLLYESLGPESLANSTALARSSSTVLASSSTVLANSSCVTISLWARLVLAEFVLNSGRREKVSSPGVALDPTRPPYPQLRTLWPAILFRSHFEHYERTCLAIWPSQNRPPDEHTRVPLVPNDADICEAFGGRSLTGRHYRDGADTKEA